MSLKAERFWIFFILRLAFGLFFIVAAINQFSAGGPADFGPDFFARTVTKPYETNWMGSVLPMVDIGPTEVVEDPDGNVVKDKDGNPKEVHKEDLVHTTYFFMFALPFIFALLSIPIITGIFLKPALRLSAILLVCLGVGSYIGATDFAKTANDFFFAFLICVGLHYMAKHDDAE